MSKQSLVKNIPALTAELTSWLEAVGFKDVKCVKAAKAKCQIGQPLDDDDLYFIIDTNLGQFGLVASIYSAFDLKRARLTVGDLDFGSEPVTQEEKKETFMIATDETLVVLFNAMTKRQAKVASSD